MSKNDDLLAFVHIEKAAGTTFIHTLRKNYLFSYLDVRPLRSDSGGLFRAVDYKTSKKLLPNLSCIAGHAVKPFSDLHTVVPDVRYITILRDPVKRYLSQYQYSEEHMKRNRSFKKFVEMDEFKNFQTKKYSRKGDLEEAKRVLEERMFLIGFVEHYDEFLLLLRKQLLPFKFDPYYQRKNEATNRDLIDEVAETHRDRILENNALDIELYRYAREVIYPKFLARYGADFDKDLERFKAENEHSKSITWKQYVDYVLRRVYLYPVTSLFRILNGTSGGGSY